MRKSKKREKRAPCPGRNQRAASQPESPQPQDQEEQSRKFGWIPLWGWVLIFLVPLVSSEFMFYRAGRGVSMILFPVAWIGFWVVVMRQSGWPILKRRKKR